MTNRRRLLSCCCKKPLLVHPCEPGKYICSHCRWEAWPAKNQPEVKDA